MNNDPITILSGYTSHLGASARGRNALRQLIVLLDRGDMQGLDEQNRHCFISLLEAACSSHAGSVPEIIRNELQD